MTTSTMDPVPAGPVAPVARRTAVGQPLSATEDPADTVATEALPLVQAANARAEQATARSQPGDGRLSARNAFD